jgi:hypothetical protein
LVGKSDNNYRPSEKFISLILELDKPPAGIPEAPLHNFLSVDGYAGSQKGPAAMQPAQGPSQRTAETARLGSSIAINDPFPEKSIPK